MVAAGGPGPPVDDPARAVSSGAGRGPRAGRRRERGHQIRVLLIDPAQFCVQVRGPLLDLGRAGLGGGGPQLDLRELLAERFGVRPGGLFRCLARRRRGRIISKASLR